MTDGYSPDDAAGAVALLVLGLVFILLGVGLAFGVMVLV